MYPCIHRINDWKTHRTLGIYAPVTTAGDTAELNALVVRA